MADSSAGSSPSRLPRLSPSATPAMETANSDVVRLYDCLPTAQLVANVFVVVGAPSGVRSILFCVIDGHAGFSDKTMPDCRGGWVRHTG